MALTKLIYPLPILFGMNPMSSQKTVSHTDNLELEAWRQAAFALISLAALVFFAEHFFGPIFDVILEICIFYVPAVTIVLLYLYFRKKLSV